MKPTWLFFACLLLLSAPSFGQLVNPAMRQVYESYLNDDLEAWAAAVSVLEKDHSLNGSNLYELTLAQYGLLGGYLVKGEGYEDKFSALLDKASFRAERLLNYPDYQAEAHAFMGAMVSMRIEKSPMKGLYLVSESKDHIAQSLALGPDKPEGWIEKANLRFHAPRLFGGDNDEAIECYEHAIQLFDQQPWLKADNWLYLHALAWLGQAYEKAGKNEQALMAYRKALAHAPNFRLVRDDFLPKLKIKLRE
jgi:tetratricopeptide (TPR) repeat protein